jgi:predicted phosphodiesterase
MIWDKLKNRKTERPKNGKTGFLVFKFLSFLVCVFCLWFVGDWCFAFSKVPDITPETTTKLVPKVATVESFSFVVFGDNRDGDMIFMDLIKKLNQKKDIAFVVNTGDFLKFKLYHVPGNHDLVENGYKYYKKYIRPQYYYSFDYQNSHFVVLNNAFKQSFNAKQFNWLKEDLAATKKENIFVFMHRPTFDPTEIYKGYVMSGRETVKELMKVFKRYKVDYVFAGHLHGYARAEREGVIYVVTGGAGAPLYLPRDFGGFYHYVRIKVEGDNIKDEVLKTYE